MKPTIFFGEIMARFSPPGHLRLGQAMPGQIDVTFAGAEANAAVAVARLGGVAEFVTALPANPIADSALAVLRGAGVGVGNVVRSELGRFGLYFVETGASQRGGLVVYDREGSSFAVQGDDAYPWKTIFANAGWFHTSGVTAGVSQPAAAAMAGGVRAARKTGVPVSCDLNFRRKLWRWDSSVSPEALFQRTFATILPGVDVLIGNPQDLALTIGEEFNFEPVNVCEPHLALARRVAARFPNLRSIAMTLRQNHSASFNRWGALLYSISDGSVLFAPMTGATYEPYQIHNIIDRVGTGDVFAGALILALQSGDLSSPLRAIAFATAASCLAHTVSGDFFHGSRAEVEALMNGDGAGHVSR